MVAVKPHPLRRWKLTACWRRWQKRWREVAVLCAARSSFCGEWESRLLRAAAEMAVAGFAAALARTAAEEEATALAADWMGGSSAFLGSQAGRLRDICRSSSRWHSNLDGDVFCNLPRSDRACRILGRKAQRHMVCSGSSARDRGCANLVRARPILDAEEKRVEVENYVAGRNSPLLAVRLERCAALGQAMAAATE